MSSEGITRVPGSSWGYHNASLRIGLPIEQDRQRRLTLVMMPSELRPVELDGVALTLIASTSFFLALNTLVVALRIWVRSGMFAGKKAWGHDDSVICMSYMAYVPSSALAIIAGLHGVGTRDSKLDPANHAMAAGALGIWAIGYGVSLNLAKASIALAAMRISVDRRCTIALWIFMVIEMVISITCLTLLVIICVPPGAQWDPSIGSCKSYTFVPYWTWPFTVVNVSSDLGCAIVPLFIIKKLNIRKRVKRSLMAVLALGGFASLGSVVRIPYLKYYTVEEDKLYYFGIMLIGCGFETGLGIFASCLPPLNYLILRHGHKSELARSTAPGMAVATIGGTPLPMLNQPPRCVLAREAAAVAVDSQWSRLAGEESGSDGRSEVMA